MTTFWVWSDFDIDTYDIYYSIFVYGSMSFQHPFYSFHHVSEKCMIKTFDCGVGACGCGRWIIS